MVRSWGVTFWAACWCVVGPCAALPYVLIASPAEDSVVYGYDTGSSEANDARNTKTVGVLLHFYDLPEAEAELGDVSLWFRFNRGETTTLAPPVSSALDVTLRYGTHVLEAALRHRGMVFGEEDADDPAGIPRDVDPSSIVSVTFDLLPEPGAKILRGVDGPFESSALESVPLRPSGTAFEYASCAAARDRPLRIVMVGSLQLGGQSMLALEQARRLPRVVGADGRPAFELVVASGADSGPKPKPTPLAPGPQKGASMSPSNSECF